MHWETSHNCMQQLKHQIDKVNVEFCAEHCHTKKLSASVTSVQELSTLGSRHCNIRLPFVHGITAFNPKKARAKNQ